MTRLPADEDYARSVLSIFRICRLRARQSLPVRDAEAMFLSRRYGSAHDFAAAVSYGLDSGWMTLECGHLRLTSIGDEEQACGRFE